jgi:hypothetical protein
MQSLSCSEKRIAPAIERPLLTMLRCVSVAPLGAPVVPLVNWMLMGSRASSPAVISSSAVFGTFAPRASNSRKVSMPGVGTSSMRITQRSSGSRAAFSAPGSAGQLGASVASMSR